MSIKTMIVAAAALATGCVISSSGRPTTAPAPLTYEEIGRLRRGHDYFALRNRLQQDSASRSPQTELARAIVQQAANRPEQSSVTVEHLLERTDIPDSVVTLLRELATQNHFRLFQYADGLRAVDQLLADTTRLDPPLLRDIRNMRRILVALAGTPPQTAVIRDSSRLTFVNGRIPLTVNDSLRHYVFDTGANLSTIMRSEALTLGLRILPAGIDVGTSTSRRVTADVGVADRVTIGAMEFRNVVFLVLDDAMLTFGDHRIPGIIGFPVIERMGEVRLAGPRELFVPAVAPRRTQANLVLSGLTLLTPVRWRNNQLLCRLDSGAGATQFYEPFYRRFKFFVDSAGTLITRQWGGAGGIQQMSVRIIPELSLAIGDTVTIARSVEVATQSIARREEENYLDCNIGHDILDAFPTYIVNFRDLAFLLR